MNREHYAVMKFLCVLPFLAACGGGCGASKISQLLHGGSGREERTDDELFEAVRAELGKPEDSRFCVLRPTALPSVAVMGEFEQDAGCYLLGSFIEGEWCAGDCGPRALQQAGWASATPERKRELALSWIALGHVAFDGRLLESADPDFWPEPGKPEFSAPVVTIADDQVRVSGWVQRSSGMDPETEYQFYTFEIESSGHVTPRPGTSFTVSREQRRAHEADR